MLVGYYGSSVRHLDPDDLRLTGAFDRNSFLDDLKLAPLAVDEILRLVFVQFLLPEIRRVDAGSRRAPHDII